jgi:hypothetical protein
MYYSHFSVKTFKKMSRTHNTEKMLTLKWADTYRIMAVLKVETDIIASIVATIDNVCRDLQNWHYCLFSNYNYGQITDKYCPYWNISLYWQMGHFSFDVCHWYSLDHWTDLDHNTCILFLTLFTKTHSHD